MSITNGYTTLVDIKAWISNITTSATDADLERAVEAASRSIDLHCGRVFYDAGSASARVYPAWSPLDLNVHDFSTTSGLIVKTDDNLDGTFETTWDNSGSPADYQAAPLIRTNGWPYTKIQAIDDKAFPTSRRRALVEVTARWGWAAIPDPVEQACMILATRYFERRKTSTGVQGFDGQGITIRITKTDPDVVDMLDPFRRYDELGVAA